MKALPSDQPITRDHQFPDLLRVLCGLGGLPFPISAMTRDFGDRRPLPHTPITILKGFHDSTPGIPHPTPGLVGESGSCGEGFDFRSPDHARAPDPPISFVFLRDLCGKGFGVSIAGNFGDSAPPPAFFELLLQTKPLVPFDAWESLA